MVKARRFGRAIAVCVLALSLAGCKGWGGGSTTPPPPQTRCNGQAVTSQTQVWTLTLVDSATHCAGIAQYKANSSAEAAACAKAQYGATANVTTGQLRTFFLSVYTPYCSTAQVVALTANDAIACERSTYCGNCVYHDITSQVSNGVTVDMNALADWCNTHPNP